MSRYLVTGGAGFIGSHLAEELVRRGHQVRVVDSLITGKRQNLAHVHDVVLQVGQRREPDVCRCGESTRKGQAANQRERGKTEIHGAVGGETGK